MAFYLLILFLVGDVQSMFDCEVIGYLAATLEVAAIADGLAIVTDSIIDNMTVRMLLVVMSNDNVLRVANIHLLHVLLSNLRHKVISHSVCIVR